MRDVKRLNVGSGLEGSTWLSHSFPCTNLGAQKLPGAQLFCTHRFSTLQVCSSAYCRVKDMSSAPKTGRARKPQARKIGMEQNKGWSTPFSSATEAWDSGPLHSGQP